MSYNRNLITTRIEEIGIEISKIDKKILKEAEPFKEGKVHHLHLDRIRKLDEEKEKLLHTQTELWALLGRWKDEENV